MGKIKSQMLVVMLILAAAITESCTITTTTNKYYAYPDPNEKLEANAEVKMQCEADTLKKPENTQNE